MKPKLRQLINTIAAELDCRVISDTQNSHHKVTAQHIPTGKTFKMAIPVSPSCHRFEQNQRRDWRRMVAKCLAD